MSPPPQISVGSKPMLFLTFQDRAYQRLISGYGTRLSLLLPSSSRLCLLGFMIVSLQIEIGDYKQPR